MHTANTVKWYLKRKNWIKHWKCWVALTVCWPEYYRSIEAQRRAGYTFFVSWRIVIEDDMEWAGIALCSLGCVCSVNGEDWEREGRKSTVAGKPAALKPKNIKTNLACVRQNNLLWVTKWLFAENNIPFRDLGHRAGSSVYYTLWGLETKRGKKTITLEKDGLALNSDNKTRLHDKWSACCRGWRPNRKKNRKYWYLYYIWPHFNIDSLIAILW